MHMSIHRKLHVGAPLVGAQKQAPLVGAQKQAPLRGVFKIFIKINALTLAF